MDCRVHHGNPRLWSASHTHPNCQAAAKAALAAVSFNQGLHQPW
jgi:hypothetical protein